jgi:hypothetical protein
LASSAFLALTLPTFTAVFLYLEDEALDLFLTRPNVRAPKRLYFSAFGDFPFLDLSDLALLLEGFSGSTTDLAKFDNGLDGLSSERAFLGDAEFG